MIDFFISYNKSDRAWAEWTAWELEEAGYSTVLQAWDFNPGANFVDRMNQAVSEAERTVAILSQDYLNARFTHPEWHAAFAKDPTGEKRTLLPVRVREVNATGLLAQIVHIDLVGLEESDARKALLEGVQLGRRRPSDRPRYPGTSQRSVIEQPSFPGSSVGPAPPPNPPGGKLVLYVIACVMIAAILGSIALLRQPAPPTLRTSPFVDDGTHGLTYWKIPESGWNHDPQKNRIYIEHSPHIGYATELSDPSRPMILVADFTMDFNLIIEKGSSAAWALRFRNSKNYYLFYLSGEGGTIPCSPNQNGKLDCKFATYIVRGNDDISQIQPESVRVPVQLTQGGNYAIRITANGNQIDHFITANTPDDSDEKPLGRLVDESPKHLAYGGIGFRTIGDERFSIANIVVIPATAGAPH